MDITPKLLREVQFREQWRGYNPEEVDELLERVARGLEGMQARLADAQERASKAERRLAERTDDDEIRRTLVLAQRTAVASVEEAKAEADRLVRETEARCRQLVAEAEAEAAQLEAEVARRRRTELGDLAEQRAALQLDIDALRDFIEDQRAQIADALRALAGSLPTGEPPAVADLDTFPATQAFSLDDDEGDEDDASAVPAAPVAPDTRSAGGGARGALEGARAELAAALERAGVDAAPDPDPDPEPEPEPERVPDPQPEPEPRAEVDEGWEAAVHGRLAVAPIADDAEHTVWSEEHDADPFLAELRKAVTDTGPLGPREDEPLPLPTYREDAGEGAPAGGFFRRGRRRT